MKRIHKLLVANRGEIAVRVIRGARRLGLTTVAVYSDADADALHVREADEAVRIGPPPAAQSYLDIDRIIEAARASGAEAIHPGYGFLSENAEFARACAAADLVFVGPSPESIDAMGNKSAAKQRMIAAGVPCVPGYQGEDQSDEKLLAEAQRIGLPVMIKAAAGGGGRGMRLVERPEQLLEAIRSARSEAASAFGSGELLIEKAVVDARHVEIQVFGDHHGNVVYIGERDCSVQRRNQKVVEESPSPAVDEALRRRMGEAAVAAAHAVDYVGAGTVEFLLGRDGAFYFLEMNTRLQVEHPVTEMVYDLDLVEWQLRVAQGEPLPLDQDAINARRRGHAIEVRLCAEDPTQNYLPQTGRVLAWKPPQGPGIRVDHGLLPGQQISPYYDSMQAKIIAWGEDREAARGRLIKALDECTLLGVVSNRDFLIEVLSEDAFADGDFSTAFIERHFPQKVLSRITPPRRHVALAAVALYVLDAEALAADADLPEELIGWYSSHDFPTDFKLRWRETEYELELLVRQGRQFTVDVDGERCEITLRQMRPDGFDYLVGGVLSRARMARDGDVIWLCAEGATHAYTDLTFAPAAAAAPGSDGRILAHSDGRIADVPVEEGARVAPGQTVAVLEAMKMEFQLTTPVAGTVRSVKVAPGDQVKARQLLVEIEPEQEG